MLQHIKDWILQKRLFSKHRSPTTKLSNKVLLHFSNYCLNLDHLCSTLYPICSFFHEHLENLRKIIDEGTITSLSLSLK